MERLRDDGEDVLLSPPDLSKTPEKTETKTKILFTEEL